ncbi:MAG: guanylate kinase [Deltaproteobacteria bacterium]|nr:guanylate kinase [Deltaproteobacteria bacterium]MBW2338963.1 guanylate kinase [Deltaproteobacteria bacterium]
MKVLLPKKGELFVVTAPSGTGKTTIIDIIRKKVEGIGYSVSHTTRPPRRGEINGVHYCFVTREDFEKMIEAHEFAEWAIVYDHLYGTSVSGVESTLSSGKDLLLDLDIQGAQEIKKQFPEATLIFILPPSLKILQERLQRRSAQDDTNIALRMEKAVEEIRKCRGYDFLIINDDLNQAAREVEGIIVAQRARTERRFPLVHEVFHMG